jgi:Xaa-Pro aminopeptidase
MGEDVMLVLFSGAPPMKSSDLYYDYYPDRNFYYLTGLDRKELVFVYIKSDILTRETLLIPAFDAYTELVEGRMLTKEEALAASGIERVETVDHLDRLIETAINICGVRTLYLDMGTFSLNSAPTEAQAFAAKIKSGAAHIKIADVSDVIGELRMIKSEQEIAEIKKAIDITNEAFTELMRAVRPGMNEYELDALFRYTARKNGATEGFQVIASGLNATAPHYMKNDAEIEDGSLVLADCGVIWKNYYSDITRTFPANGKFSALQRELYEVVLEAQKLAIDSVRPGVSVAELSSVLTDKLAEECVRIGLIADASEIGEYWYGGIGHFLGLECHDMLRLFVKNDQELKEGMVLTIEPGLYVPEENTGIRIEDDVLVTKDGCEVLSKDIIKSVDEIEALMARSREKAENHQC